LLPAVALVLLPKCPLCFAAWFGIMGSLGAASWLDAVWGLPLAVGLLSLTMTALTWRAWRIGDARPWFAGLLGSGLLLAGKWSFDAPPLLVAGLSLLLVASLWSGRAAPSKAPPREMVPYEHPPGR
jgi:hypothetical protein